MLLISILIQLGPRVINVIWWIFNPRRWDFTFGSFIWPILGIIFLPWITLMFVLVVPNKISGFEVFLLVVAIIADAMSFAGGGYGNRDRIPGYGE